MKNLYVLSAHNHSIPKFLLAVLSKSEKKQVIKNIKKHCKKEVKLAFGEHYKASLKEYYYQSILRIKRIK
jgi:2-iminoacetate synthase ThiH